MLVSNISPNDMTAEFLRLTARFSELAAREGHPVRPSHAGRPRYFDGLPLDMQISVLGNFNRYLHVCETVLAGGGALAHDQTFLWRMFQQLGVRPVSTLLSNIEDDDVIEIYSAEFVQIFRNLRFFSLCSYTLDELLCRPFWDLFRRDQGVSAKIMELAQDVFGGKAGGLLYYNTGVHTVDEIDSESRLHSVIENKFLSPLFDATGRVVAAVNVIRSISCVSMRDGAAPVIAPSQTDQHWTKEL